MSDWLKDRKSTIASQEEVMALLLALRAGGITEHALLDLFEKYPRRLFLNAAQVHGKLRPDSFAPIPCGQIQTSPLIIAHILRALDVMNNHKVLEVGTGSGFQTVLLSCLCEKLYTIERYRSLQAEAEIRFKSTRRNNIISEIGDGESGWPQKLTFDRIVLNAGLQDAPTILLEQLKTGGILIAPIMEDKIWANIVVYEKTHSGLQQQQLLRARFLPLISGIALNL